MLTEQLKEWMYVYGSWGWKWVRGGLVDGKENLMPPSAKSRVSPWRSSMDPTQSQSQNQESRFSHRGKGNGKSFLTRTNMTPKVLILVKKRKPVSGPLTGATACFQGRERIFKHQSRKHLTKWWAEYNYLLSPPTPLQAGKWLPGSSVSVRWPWTAAGGDLPVSTQSMEKHFQSIWQMMLSVWEQQAEEERLPISSWSALASE